MLSKWKAATDGLARSSDTFDDCSASLPPEMISKWKTKLLAWHRDGVTQMATKIHIISFGKVRLVLCILKY